MKNKIVLAVLALMFSTSLPLLAINNPVSLSTQTTTIHVQTKTVPVCWSFDIEITVTDVKDLFSFKIRLSYNATILEYLGAEKGSFWSKVGGNFRPFIDTLGDLRIEGGFPSETANGSGTLATIRFHCTGVGESKLLLHDTELSNSTGGNIPHEKEQGKCTQVTEISGLYVDQNYTLCANMDCNGDGLFIINANNIVLDLNGYIIRTIPPNGKGAAVRIDGKSNVRIMNGTIYSFQKGLAIRNCNNVNITNIEVQQAKIMGLEIRDSNNIRITKNNVSGIEEGIYLDSSHHVNIRDNTISSNSDGIYMLSSHHVNISRNTISENSGDGIHLISSFDNAIWINDFAQNKRHAESSNSANNSWNLGYPHGGNYWDDYNGSDIYSGPFQNVTGSDGIGDKPHDVGENNQDEYPLVNKHGSALQVCDTCRVIVPQKGENITKTLSVAVFTDSSVADLHFNGTLGLISFNVTGGTSCKVIVSRELLDGAFELKINNTIVAPILNWDTGYVFASFNYPSGSHQVEIRGEILRRCDLNSDNRINIIDITSIAKEFESAIIYEEPKEEQD